MIDWEHFEKNGFVVIHDFITDANVAGIREELKEKWALGSLKHAGIGKSQQYHVDNKQRGDFIHWIDYSNAGLNTILFLKQLDELRIELNRSFYLGLKKWESHYTHYPIGTFYARHVDQHTSGSARKISFVFYLNENWQESDGGQLIIYKSDEQIGRIFPSSGTLAIFLSELEHEVLTTNKPRESITGWMLDVDDLFL